MEAIGMTVSATHRPWQQFAREAADRCDARAQDRAARVQALLDMDRTNRIESARMTAAGLFCVLLGAASGPWVSPEELVSSDSAPTHWRDWTLVQSPVRFSLVEEQGGLVVYASPTDTEPWHEFELVTDCASLGRALRRFAGASAAEEQTA